MNYPISKLVDNFGKKTKLKIILFLGVIMGIYWLKIMQKCDIILLMNSIVEIIFN